MGKKNAAPDELKELLAAKKFLEGELASGTKVREQSQEERNANPTIYGRAAFPLTDDERTELHNKIEQMDASVRKLQNNE